MPRYTNNVNNIENLNSCSLHRRKCHFKKQDGDAPYIITHHFKAKTSDKPKECSPVHADIVTHTTSPVPQ